MEHLRSEHVARQKRRRGEDAPVEETKGALAFVDRYGGLDIPSKEGQRQIRQEKLPTLSAIMVQAMPSVARSDEIRVAKKAQHAGKSVTRRNYAQGESNGKVSGSDLQQHLDELQEQPRRCVDAIMGMYSSSLAQDILDGSTLAPALLGWEAQRWDPRAPRPLQQRRALLRPLEHHCRRGFGGEEVQGIVRRADLDFGCEK